jgi:hypothetical protein
MDELIDKIRDEKDAARRARLLCAMMVKNRNTALPWYDGTVNDRINIARRYLDQVAPSSRPQFEERLAVFNVNPNFDMKFEKEFLPTKVYADLLEYISSVEPDEFHKSEIETLGRYKLTNLPAFAPAMACAQAYLEKQIGCSLRPIYAMFVRYFSDGRLPVHLDSLDSQFSVGICIDRGGSWPLHCSSIVATPLDIDLAGWSAQSVLDDPALSWTAHDPEPNEAFVFAPANQWHWRDAIGPGHDRPYDMLYFSFVDPAAYDLLSPKRWTKGFAIDELDDLAEVFAMVDRKPG